MSGPYKGTGYWATQIGALAFFALLGSAGGVFVVMGDSEDKGDGGMMILIGIVFLVVLIVMIRKFATTTKEQRAVYAWAIMQQHSASAPAAAAMGVAEKARQGTLSRAEIEQLQALRPENPYPGQLPPETGESGLPGSGH
ncbi:hypothetical protein ACWCXX_21305 [Streptomyces sp. NPDC001732]